MLLAERQKFRSSATISISFAVVSAGPALSCETQPRQLRKVRARRSNGRLKDYMQLAAFLQFQLSGLV